MMRGEILAVASDYVSSDRQAQHGKPEDTFQKIADFWTTYTGHLITPEDVAAMMGLLKIARIDANPTNDDNWIDLAGYAACGGELADREIANMRAAKREYTGSETVKEMDVTTKARR